MIENDADFAIPASNFDLAIMTARAESYARYREEECVLVRVNDRGNYHMMISKIWDDPSGNWQENNTEIGRFQP